MKDNQGVTLIELIVVMLIMGILAGGALYGIRSLDTGSAKSTTERIKSLINHVRIENMSKGKTYYLVIEEENGSYYSLVQIIRDTGDSETILKDKLDLRQGQITFRIKGDSKEYLVDQTLLLDNSRDKLEVCFRKDTGGLLSNRDGETVITIGIEASGRAYTIHMVETTGKFYME